MKPAWVAAACLALSAASCAPRASVARGPAVPPLVHIESVPFFPDNTDQCGPSCLASLLAYWNKPATPAELRSEIYIPRLKGTLPMDMRPALSRRGLAARVVSGTLDDLKSEIRAGRPVVAYLDFGTRRRPIGHYVVVTGFDDARRELIIHSALRRDKRASYRRFDRGWRDTNRWMLVAAPLKQAPALARGGGNEWTAPDRGGSNGLSAEENVRLGQVYETQGLRNEARRSYEAALSADGRYAPALLALGNLAYEAGDYRRARRFFRRILRDDPSHGGANNNLAMTYLAESKHLGRAEALALRAMESAEYRPYASDTLEKIRTARAR